MTTTTPPDARNALAEIVAGLDGVTPGIWYPGHLGTEGSCQCRSIVDDGLYTGAIASVHVDNGMLVGEGGNDAPPADEAAANMRHIARCNPVALRSIADYVAALEAQVEGMRVALEPFAKVEPMDVYESEDDDARGVYVLTQGDFRRAHAALQSSETTGEK